MPSEPIKIHEKSSPQITDSDNWANTDEPVAPQKSVSINDSIQLTQRRPTRDIVTPKRLIAEM